MACLGLFDLAGLAYQVGLVVLADMKARDLVDLVCLASLVAW
jgi:hypothetical protein